MNNTHKIKEILKKELVPALGCTEPIAVIYCAAAARAHAKGVVESVCCRASVNIIKNAASVAIPGTDGLCGVALAAAIGAVAGDYTKGLEVAADLSAPQVHQAVQLCSSGVSTVTVDDSGEPLYIKITLKTTRSLVVAVVSKGHTNLSYLSVDGKVIMDTTANPEQDDDAQLYSVLNLLSIYQFATTVDISELQLIEKSVEINSRISAEGLRVGYGLQVGKTIQDNIDGQLFSMDLCNNAMMCTAAASDARMAGCMLPAMSNSGSGNQGITCTMPVVASAKYLDKDDETMLRAVTVSNLCTIYIKSHLQKLSAVCGAIGAAAGAGCGVVYLLGGGTSQMASVIKNVLGNLAGMFCDGAKGSCGLKVSTCVSAAMHSATLAMNNRSINATDGIVGENEIETLQNYSKLSSEGMSQIDEVILSIILNK